MKTNILLQVEVEVDFDENSEGFDGLFDNYVKYFYDCNKQEFAEIIAKEVAAKGAAEPIEGIGYVRINGKPQYGVDHPVNVKIDLTNGNDVKFYVAHSESD